jgi:hypothetical protein
MEKVPSSYFGVRTAQLNRQANRPFRVVSSLSVDTGQPPFITM